MPRIHHGGGWSPTRFAEQRRGRALQRDLEEVEQAGGEREAEQRRQQQRLRDVGRLRPVDARGAVTAAEQRVGDADTHDRTDQGVRARSRQAEPPGAEIPDDGGDQEREHHGKAGTAADLQDQLDRKQRDDAERDGAAGEQHADQVEHARPHHGDMGRQRAGVDHGGDRVCGVMEAVDEFEAERDQQCDEQQDIRQERSDARAGGVDIGIDAVGNEQQRGRNHAQIDNPGERMKALVEVRTLL
ncbi:hypothetical protein ABIF13_001177 [Bradyrhizobium elkanii]